MQRWDLGVDVSVVARPSTWQCLADRTGSSLRLCPFEGDSVTSGREHDRPGRYEIRVKGKLDARWSHWFANLQIIPQPNGESLLTGPIPDQAALYGAISRMRDLGLVLISVHRVPREEGMSE
jgi:hypothetical protein